MSTTSPRTRNVPRVEIEVVAVVLDLDQVAHELVAVVALRDVEKRGHARVVLGRADAVDAAHRRDHDDVAPRQQRRGRRVTQLLDLLVDRRVLLDEGVGGRDVRLGLVVVVVADEVDDGVVGQELAQLGGELRRERLVRRHHERGPLHRLDDLGHRERLAGAGDAEKRLVAQIPAEPLGQLRDRLGLVAGGLERRDDAQRPPGRTRLGDVEVSCVAHWSALRTRPDTAPRSGLCPERPSARSTSSRETRSALRMSPPSRRPQVGVGKPGVVRRKCGLDLVVALDKVAQVGGPVLDVDRRV